MKGKRDHLFICLFTICSVTSLPSKYARQWEEINEYNDYQLSIYFQILGSILQSVCL